MSEIRDLDDLSVLARRSELSREEELELDQALALAPAERFLHEAGRGFDRDSTVLVEDERLIERVKERLASKRSERPLLARWRFASGVAAGLLLAATAALGVELTRSFLRPTLPVSPAAIRPPAELRPVAPHENAPPPAAPSLVPAPSDSATHVGDSKTL